MSMDIRCIDIRGGELFAEMMMSLQVDGYS